jgi:hypothetical protein
MRTVKIVEYTDGGRKDAVSQFLGQFDEHVVCTEKPAATDEMKNLHKNLKTR